MKTVKELDNELFFAEKLLKVRIKRKADDPYDWKKVEAIKADLEKAKAVEEMAEKFDTKTLKLIPEMIEALKLIDRMEDGGYLIFDRKPTQMMPGLHEAVLDALAFYRTHF